MRQSRGVTATYGDSGPVPPEQAALSNKCQILKCLAIGLLQVTNKQPRRLAGTGPLVCQIWAQRPPLRPPLRPPGLRQCRDGFGFAKRLISAAGLRLLPYVGPRTQNCSENLPSKYSFIDSFCTLRSALQYKSTYHEAQGFYGEMEQMEAK
jgi:hypothetical protein